MGLTTGTASTGRVTQVSLASRLAARAGGFQALLGLGLGVSLALLLAEALRISAAEEEYASQIHSALFAAFWGRWRESAAWGIVVFGAGVVPMAFSAWLDWRLVRRFAGRPTILPGFSFSRQAGAPLRLSCLPRGLMLVKVTLILALFCGIATFNEALIFDPVVLPESPYFCNHDGRPRNRIVINVIADGRYRIQGQEYSSQALAQLLAEAAKLKVDSDGLPTQAVHIRADHRAPYGAVSGILDSCRQARIWRVSFGARIKPE